MAEYRCRVEPCRIVRKGLRTLKRGLHIFALSMPQQYSGEQRWLAVQCACKSILNGDSDPSLFIDGYK
jgi:hypothetical protein